MTVKRFLILFGLFISLLLTLTACGGGSGGGGGAIAGAPEEGYTQADLTGTWNFMTFGVSYDEAGGERGTISVNNNGSVNFIAFESTNGDSAPPDGSRQVTINESGEVFYSNWSTSHCYMSSAKDTIVCVESYGAFRAQTILFKTSGVTFTNADLTGPFTLNYHALFSSPSGINFKLWLYGTANVDSSRQLTYTTSQDPYGSGHFTGTDSWSLGANGFFAFGGGVGMISTDKKMFVTIVKFTDPGTYGLFIFTKTDETFSGVADLAGKWQGFALWNGDNPDSFGWGWTKMNISSAGVGSMTQFLDSYGHTSLAPDFTLFMTTDGIVTHEGNPTFHGVLSHDRLIATSTNDFGFYELDILIK